MVETNKLNSIQSAQRLALASISTVEKPYRIFALCFIGLMLCSDWSVHKNTSLLWLVTNVTHVCDIRIF